eukprot:63198-Alexandrium_andersonii.AAC.1
MAGRLLGGDGRQVVRVRLVGTRGRCGGLAAAADRVEARPVIGDVGELKRTARKGDSRRADAGGLRSGGRPKADVPGREDSPAK